MLDFLLLVSLLAMVRPAVTTAAAAAATAPAVEWQQSPFAALSCPSTPLISQEESCGLSSSNLGFAGAQEAQDTVLEARNETTSGSQAAPEPAPAPPRSHWTGGTQCAGNFCLFANRGFAGGRGIVLITDLENLERVKAIEGRLVVPSAEEASSQQPNFHVEQVEGKGLGMLARGALYRGDSILTKTPALLAHRTFMEKTTRDERERLFDLVPGLLPAATRRLFTRQAGQFGGNKVHDIVVTNSFQVDIGEGGPAVSTGHHYANYPEVSRLNHDCRPNVAFYVDADMVHRTTVVRDVAPDEELTISYLDVMAPHAQRQHRARGAWGFACSCSQCSRGADAVAESDGRLREIAELEARLSDISSDVTLDTVDRYVALFGEERLDAKVAGPYTTAALNYNLLGKNGLAVKYARLAVEAGTNQSGTKAPDVEAMRLLAKDPQKHFTWRLRLKK